MEISRRRHLKRFQQAYAAFKLGVPQITALSNLERTGDGKMHDLRRRHSDKSFGRLTREEYLCWFHLERPPHRVNRGVLCADSRQ
jgi:hypothetical protein